MEIKATLVKALRERTGAGMMDCKKALSQAAGDIEAAVIIMRKSGVAKAVKKAARIATEGCIVIKHKIGKYVVLEVNTETDFVARDDNLKSFSGEVADNALCHDPTDVTALMETISEGQALEAKRQQLVAKLGENISVRRFSLLSAEHTVGSYLHGQRIGVLVDVEGGDTDLCKDLAMHIAANKPLYIDREDIPDSVLDEERSIYAAQAKETGKPLAVIEKMVEGRMKKYINEISLLGQAFVKDPDITVRSLLAEKAARVCRFIRYEVGEGLEKRADNFVEEVMAQAKGE